MLMKLLVSVFERAKSRITSTHSLGRTSPDSDNEFDTNNVKQTFSSGPSIIHQQPRLSISKWLCTSPGSINKSITSSSKSNKVRRSSSWRSLKERGSHYIEHLTSRTLSVDELRPNNKQQQQRKTNSLCKQQSHQHDLSHSSILNSAHHHHQKSSSFYSTRTSHCDVSKSLSKNAKNYDRLSSTLVQYSLTDKKTNLSTKSHRKNQQQIFSRNNTSSGGGDSGYSEESFAGTTLSSHTRSLHTSCPHCHCEQRSSFKNYKKSNENSSTDSSTSDTTIHKDIHSPDLNIHLLQQKQSLSASRSYPHIKPLPKTTIKPLIQQQQPKRTRTMTAKRRRHLSCDSSLWTRTQTHQPIDMTTSPVISKINPIPVQRHFTAIGMMNCDPSFTYSKTLSSLPKNNHIFGELNLAAIELDSVRTLDYHRTSFSSTYSSSVTSSSSSINTDQQYKKYHTYTQKKSRRKGTYLVWHEYKNSSLLSATHGTKIFSVIRGDQVRLLRRIGKSTLLVKKEDDGSIGFLPQSCLAHDQINSFLSVKGLKETVL